MTTPDDSPRPLDPPLSQGPSPARLRRLSVLLVAVVVIAGIAVATLVWRQTDRDATRNVQQTAARLADRLAAEVHTLQAGLAGAVAVLGSEGQPTKAAFDDYASRLVQTTVVTALAFAVPVEETDRQEFEQRTGVQIRERAEGGYVPAGPRSSYVPIVWGYPSDGPTVTPLLGFDLLSNPPRAAAIVAAASSSDVQFTAPIASLPNGQPSFFVVKAVGNGGRPVGYVATAVTASLLQERLQSLLDDSTQVLLRDGSVTLFGDGPATGQGIPIDAGGRTWTLFVRRDAPRHTTALVTLLVTLLAAGAIGDVLRRNRRHTEANDRAARDIHRIGRLSEHLAGCGSTGHVVAAAPLAGESVGADLVAVVPTEPFAQRLRLPTRAGELPMALERALQATLATGDSRLVHGAKLNTVITMPLLDTDGELLGAMGWGWTAPQRDTPRLRSALEAMRALWQTALERAIRADVQRRQATALSTLGQQLSVARAVTDIATAVVRYGPLASGNDLVALAVLVEPPRGFVLHHRATADDESLVATSLDALAIPDEALDLLRRGRELTFPSRADIDRSEVLRAIIDPSISTLTLFPLRSSSGQVLGVLGFANVGGHPTGDRDNRRSIADLVGQTLERAELFDQQSQIVVQLQERTLSELPMIEGTELVARYLPAAREVGVGGDWYDAEVLPDGRLVLVVGDVVGHGIAAVVDMIEISGLIAALARTEPDLAAVAPRAGRLVATGATPLGRMATAVVLRVDPVSRQAEYVRLGHPPPLLRTADGDVHLLDGGLVPPLGVPAAASDAAVLTLPPDSTLLLYTDGLVERRGESLDVGIARLAEAFRRAGASPLDRALDRIIEQCIDGHENVDDVAALMISLPG